MDKNNLVTLQDLHNMKDEIINELEAMTCNTTTNKEWLRSAEAMEMLSVSTGTLQNFRINDDIPFTKIGGTLYYERKAIIKLLNDNKKAA
jgi:hypothetical protein